MKRITRKAFAYITYHQKLLVFSHPYEPEAGIQVPARTIEEGETPEQAVVREAFEETGLTGLVEEKRCPSVPSLWMMIRSMWWQHKNWGCMGSSFTRPGK